MAVQITRNWGARLLLTFLKMVQLFFDFYDILRESFDTYILLISMTDFLRTTGIPNGLHSRLYCSFA